MPISIRSGASAGTWTVDPTSKAGRVTLYGKDGNPLAVVPVSGLIAVTFATPIGVSGTVSVTLPATLGVSGTLTSQVDTPLAVSGTVTALVAGPFGVSGTVTASSPLAVSGTLTVRSPLAVSGTLTAVAGVQPISGSISSYNPPGASGSFITDTPNAFYAAVPLSFSVVPGSVVRRVSFTTNGNTFANNVSGSQMLPSLPPAGLRFVLEGWNIASETATVFVLWFRDGCKANGGNLITAARYAIGTSATNNWQFQKFLPYGIPLTLGNSLYVAQTLANPAIEGVIWGRFE